MKKFLLLSLLLPIALLSFAQKRLLDSRQRSVYTYVYRLDDASTLLFLTGHQNQIKDEALTNEVTHFLTDKPAKIALPPGNYLKVAAVQNRLNYQLIQQHNARLIVMDNALNTQFILTDSAGNAITNAQVYRGNKAIAYDQQAETYHLKTSKKDSIYKVVYQGVNNFFIVNDRVINAYRYYYAPPKKKESVFAALFKKIGSWFSKPDDEPVRYYRGRPMGNPGYIVFNKPKYRPGDTVKFKAFILDKKTKLPIEDKRLMVRYNNNYYRDDDDDDDEKVLGYANAYRKGGFDFKFKLVDSLDISLDETIVIRLESVNKVKQPAQKNNYNNNNKKKKEPDVLKHIVYETGDFRYEDYDLKSNRLNVRVDNKEQSPGKPISIYFKATDENDLNLADARINMVFMTSGIKDYGSNHEFIRDTLWQHQLKLDAVGETKLIIPDSIFPKARLDFEAHFSLLNADNQLINNSESLSWDYRDKKIDAEVAHDTLKMRYLLSGKSQPIIAHLTQINNITDTLKTVDIPLPANLIFKANASAFIIKADTLTKSVPVTGNLFELERLAYRTRDSVYIDIHTPNNQKFWYTLFSGSKIYEQGAVTALNYNKPLKYNGALSIRINYLWGGRPYEAEEAIPFIDNFLRISVNQQSVITPGQKSDVEVSVKDHTGKPVPNADLTAYAITSKFEDYYAPAMPYLGDAFKPRKLANQQTIKPATSQGKLKLNWQHWAKSMGLDTIEYYKFTHTDSIYRMAGPAVNGTTQLAPFIVSNGNILPVHILYIDERPVYFSQSQDLHRYTFAVTPGPHMLRFRTTNRNIILSSVVVKEGERLVLGINPAYSKSIDLTTRPMPDSLLSYETDYINHYLIGVDPNFYQHMATISQDNKTYLLNYMVPAENRFYQGPQSRSPILVGPLYGNTNAVFELKDNFSRVFLPEGKYSFEFHADLIKQKTLEKTLYKFNLKAIPADTDYTQHVLTIDETDSLWQDYVNQRMHNNYHYFYSGYPGNKLVVKADKLANGTVPYVKAILLYKNSDPNFVEVYSGRTTDLGSFSPEKYRVLFLFKDNTYYLMENVLVKKGGTSFYSTGTIKPHPADSVSVKIYNTLGKVDFSYIDEDARIKLREAFNQKYIDYTSLDGEMSGTVLDAATGEAMAGCTINVEGTRIAVQANVDGHFYIRVPKYGRLRFSIVGYISTIEKIEPGRSIIVRMTADGKQLNETVIRGYVKRSREETTGASYIVSGNAVGQGDVQQLLQGKVAGLNIANNTPAPGKKLYIIDGVKTEQNSKYFSMNESLIASKSELSPEAAIALYGSEGANGVVIITTKKALADQTSKSQTLRRNFSDYAYWQPELKTDAEGKVKFSVTYPDDITSWRTFVLGVTDNRQTGLKESLVKSFKPLSANFVAPLFAVRGDSFSALGKVLNYTTDGLTLNRKFKYNGKTLADATITMQNAHIDTFELKAEGTDSLQFEYAITRTDGYFDGERRTIPLFDQGSLETKGAFDVLQNDTTLSVQTDPNLKEATLRAESSPLDVLLNETEHLRTYEYLCNEQLASKLKALLAEKQIRKYLKQPFKWDSDIKDIIKKLQETKNPDDTWGWWKGTAGEVWITRHVIEAMLAAQKQNYGVYLETRVLAADLRLRLNDINTPDRLGIMMLLQPISQYMQTDIYAYEKSLTPKTQLSDMDKYRLMYLRQLSAMPIVLDSLLKNMHRTMFGNIYWGKNSYYFFDNSIQQSLMAYRILKAVGGHADLLTKLRNYFLEQRGGGYWRNTYESAEILETILPDMLIGTEPPKPAALNISGAKNESVTQFPYQTKLPPGSKVTIAKTGNMPVYLTTYQKFWNADPKKVSGDITVDTWFQKGAGKITKVAGGENITLDVEVTIKADADFVMIEIPIPAGCSYTNHDQGWSYGEVHREYFKNKVSVFCRKLPIGKYHYTVNLTARYGGSYHVNPAKAEMMYFPVFYGREGMKMFDIE